MATAKPPEALLDSYAELMLVSAILSNPSPALMDHLVTVQPSDFTCTFYGQAYSLALESFSTMQRVMVREIIDAFRRTGAPADQVAALEQLHAPFCAHEEEEIITMVALVRELSARRILWRQCSILTEAMETLTAAQASEALMDTLQVLKGAEATKDRNLIQSVDAWLERKEAERQGQVTHYVPTRLWGIDGMLKGLHKRHLVTLAAGTSIGKSALALDMAVNVCEQGHPALFLSCEMDDVEVTERLLARYAGSLDPNRCAQVRGQVDDLPLVIRYRPGLTLAQVQLSAQQFKLEHPGAHLVIVDYLQIMDLQQERGEREDQAIGRVTRTLKRLAGELDLCFLLLSQFSRDSKDGEKPTLSMLKGSSSIEQDSNVVILMWRPEGENAIRKIHVAKNRQGNTGEIDIKYDGQRFKFINPPTPPKVHSLFPERIPYAQN